LANRYARSPASQCAIEPACEPQAAAETNQ
jgi:hypothetical protein